MQLKPFEAGRYDDEHIIIFNPENGKQDIFSEAEFEIAKFLKQNESESLLALLLPNIGIAKKEHIIVCLKVLRKLKKMQIVDYFAITGRKIMSDTGTLELDLEKTKVGLPAFEAMASVLVALAEKALSWMGPSLILLLSLALSAASFLFFPFERAELAIDGEGVLYHQLILLFFFVGSGALVWRGLIRSAFLKSFGRAARSPMFGIHFGFLGLSARTDEINMLGFKSRLQLNMVGLLSPLAFSAVFTGLHLGGLLGVQAAFFALSACILVTLLLACPFLGAEIADSLHVFLLRDELKERISAGLQGIFATKSSLSRELLFGLVASFVWLLVWLDCLKSFWEVIVTPVTADLVAGNFLALKIGSGFTIGALIVLLFFPVGLFAYNFIRERFSAKRRRIVVNQGEIKESLSFEERMSALERIPLFAYLNDQERLALLNEMQPAYFAHGDFLVHQGEVGREFYVLVKGHANAFYTDIGGRNFLLADLNEGDAFGEIALIDDVPRTASIVSDGGCLVLSLKKDGFDRFSLNFGSPDRIKSLIRLTSFFRRHPLFSKLGAKDQAQLIDTFSFDTITVGAEVVNSDDSFYVVYSGKIRMDTGDDSMEFNLLPDDCFGYANALNARYFALEGSGLLSVKREEFYSLIWEKLVERPELFV